MNICRVLLLVVTLLTLPDVSSAAIVSLEYQSFKPIILYEGEPFEYNLGPISGNFSFSTPRAQSVRITARSTRFGLSDYVVRDRETDDLLFGYNRQNPDWYKDFPDSNYVPIGDVHFNAEISHSEETWNSATSHTDFSLSLDSDGEVASWSIRQGDSSEGYFGGYIQTKVTSAGNNGYYSVREQTSFGGGEHTYSTDPAYLDPALAFLDFYAPDPWINKEVEEPTPEHIYVLAHGWQAGGNSSAPSYMEPLKQPILDRLKIEGIDPATVMFVDETWEEAFGPAIPPKKDFTPVFAGGDPVVLENAITTTIQSYEGSYNGSESAGIRFGNQVLDILNGLPDDAEQPKIHVIGHSLGTVVGANIVSHLYKNGVTVDRLTILDSPKNASQQIVDDLPIPDTPAAQRKAAVMAADDALLFWALMPEGSVKYVDNYYGDFSEPGYLYNKLILKGSRLPDFGQPIAGTGPCNEEGCSGLHLEGRGHREVVDEAYREIVRGFGETAWLTPGIPGDPQDVRWAPDQIFGEWLTLLDTKTQLVDDAYEMVTEGYLILDDRLASGDSTIIDQWQIDLGTVVKNGSSVDLITNSPSSISAMVNTDDIIALTFLVDLSNSGDGALSLTYEDAILWEIITGDSNSDDILSVTVPMHSSFGTGRMHWLYDSNDVGSSITLSDLQAIRVISVPEPNSLAIALVAFFITGGVKKKRSSNHHR